MRKLRRLFVSIGQGFSLGAHFATSSHSSRLTRLSQVPQQKIQKPLREEHEPFDLFPEALVSHEVLPSETGTDAKDSPGLSLLPHTPLSVLLRVLSTADPPPPPSCGRGLPAIILPFLTDESREILSVASSASGSRQPPSMFCGNAEVAVPQHRAVLTCLARNFEGDTSGGRTDLFRLAAQFARHGLVRYGAAAENPALTRVVEKWDHYSIQGPLAWTEIDSLALLIAHAVIELKPNHALWITKRLKQSDISTWNEGQLLLILRGAALLAASALQRDYDETLANLSTGSVARLLTLTGAPLFWSSQLKMDFNLLAFASTELLVLASKAVRHTTELQDKSEQERMTGLPLSTVVSRGSSVVGALSALSQLHNVNQMLQQRKYKSPISSFDLVSLSTGCLLPKLQNISTAGLGVQTVPRRNRTRVFKSQESFQRGDLHLAALQPLLSATKDDSLFVDVVALASVLQLQLSSDDAVLAALIRSLRSLEVSTVLFLVSNLPLPDACSTAIRLSLIAQQVDDDRFSDLTLQVISSLAGPLALLHRPPACRHSQNYANASIAAEVTSPTATICRFFVALRSRHREVMPRLREVEKNFSHAMAQTCGMSSMVSLAIWIRYVSTWIPYNERSDANCRANTISILDQLEVGLKEGNACQQIGWRAFASACTFTAEGEDFSLFVPVLKRLADSCSRNVDLVSAAEKRQLVTALRHLAEKRPELMKQHIPDAIHGLYTLWP